MGKEKCPNCNNPLRQDGVCSRCEAERGDFSRLRNSELFDLTGANLAGADLRCFDMIDVCFSSLCWLTLLVNTNASAKF